MYLREIETKLRDEFITRNGFVTGIIDLTSYCLMCVYNWDSLEITSLR